MFRTFIYFREELYELFDVVLDDVVSLFLCKRLDYVKPYCLDR